MLEAIQLWATENPMLALPIVVGASVVISGIWASMTHDIF